MESIRLNKYLSQQGVCSRREADRLIREGKVLVDGKTADMGMKVDETSRILCNGKPVGKPGNQPVKPVLLVVNKPRGVVCTTSDKDRAQNIVEFLNYPVRVYPIGRLDKDSEGLLLMTNQGDLVNRIMRSGNAHEKEYEVRVDRPLTKAFLDGMAAGVFLEELDAMTLPCSIRPLGRDRFSIILTQGLNRQIRRMCAYFGYRVLTLKRVRIMNIRLGGLKTGAFRDVTREEWKKLQELLQDSTSLSAADAQNRLKTGENREVQHGKTAD
ncbi:MAG: pseudouridine synthase [Lachnospiraceae bacterium]